jgi:hypothetical protein
VPQEVFDEMLISYYDYLDVLQTELAEAKDGELSAATKDEIGQTVLDASKYAPKHFRIVQ